MFGSYAKNTTHRDSDIDVAFYSTYELFYWPRNRQISLK
ncbi:nucleotidyltransferase domain-containing protein [Peribacillus sp. NJ11]|nr:nucleotidyltransferase domain-containing protein [Peribacillus sp. NJ11]MDM5221114.1 nucleotidyltransferase domain-containing protein [Peribacillus sp. NJ11]